MPNIANGDLSVMKDFDVVNGVNGLPCTSDVNFINTTIAFDIEENRRRRAELANDVNELINISKFFQQSYANVYVGVDGDGHGCPTIRKTHEKKNKNPMATKLGKSASCITANARGRDGKVSHTKLNNAAGATKGNKPSAAVTHAMPPVFDFDHDKLNEYCLDIVEEYFKKNQTTDVSDNNIQAKGKYVECVRRNATNGSKVESAQRQSKIECNKYASVSARYMNKSTNRKPGKESSTSVRNSWISARSVAILENVNRTGTEVKKHNCVAQEAKNQSTLGLSRKKFATQRNRSLENFQRCHPEINLIPSATVFPRRTVKVCNDDPPVDAMPSPSSCDSIAADEEAINNPQTLDDGAQQQSSATVGTNVGHEEQRTVGMDEANKGADAK